MITPDEMMMDAERVAQVLYMHLPNDQYNALSMVMGTLLLSRNIYEQSADEELPEFSEFINMALECFEEEDRQTIQ